MADSVWDGLGFTVCRFAAISPGDTYSARLGGIYGSDSMEPPFVMGHEGVFVVAMVGCEIYLSLC